MPMTLDRLAQTLGTHQARSLVQLCVTSLALLIALGEGIVIGWFLLHPTPMHYTAATGPGLAEPNVISDDYAKDFATRWLEVRYSYTPSTLAKRQETIRAWIHPRLTKKYDVECDDEKKLVKKAQQSSQMVVMEPTIGKPIPVGVLVHLEARRVMSLGDRRLPEETLKATLVLVPFPLGGHATSLVVYDIITDPPLSASLN